MGRWNKGVPDVVWELLTGGEVLLEIFVKLAEIIIALFFVAAVLWLLFTFAFVVLVCLAFIFFIWLVGAITLRLKKGGR